MRSDGTDQVKVASGSSDASQMGAPTWSPDGKRIAYIQINLGVQCANEFGSGERVAESKGRHPIFRQSLESCSALAAGWPPHIRTWVRPAPTRFKPVGGFAAAVDNSFLISETH